jgi:hypothetical protein
MPGWPRARLRRARAHREVRPRVGRWLGGGAAGEGIRGGRGRNLPHVCLRWLMRLAPPATTQVDHELDARAVMAVGHASECVRKWGARGEGRKLGVCSSSRGHGRRLTRISRHGRLAREGSWRRLPGTWVPRAVAGRLAQRTSALGRGMGHTRARPSVGGGGSAVRAEETEPGSSWATDEAGRRGSAREEWLGRGWGKGCQVGQQEGKGARASAGLGKRNWAASRLKERAADFPFIYLFLFFFSLSFVSILSNHIYTQKELQIK